MRRVTIIFMLVAVVAATIVLVGVAAASPVVTLEAVMTGEKEVPGPGDRNGTGDAKLTVSQSRVCFILKADDIRPANAAHIHEGGRKVAGPVIVTLKPPTNGFSDGCKNISRALSRDLRARPAHYYVNVHNVPFPGGAIRGQLSQ